MLLPILIQLCDECDPALQQTGIRLITTLTNFWPEFGGIGWYVDSILGPSYAYELFYSSPAVIAAYQKWVSAPIHEG